MFTRRYSHDKLRGSPVEVGAESQRHLVVGGRADHGERHGDRDE